MTSTWRFRVLAVLARAALRWERLWPRLWPAVAVIAVFVAAALFDVMPGLSGWLHALILAGFAATFTFALIHALPGLRPIKRREVLQRLERDSDLRNAPLAALEDHLATNETDAVGRALWEEHRRRLFAVVSRLTVRTPEAGMAAREPWGIRAGIVLLLVVALSVGGVDASHRLARALVPEIASVATAPLVEVWITPPDYTQTAPIFLSTGAPAPAGAPPPPPPPRRRPRCRGRRFWPASSAMSSRLSSPSVPAACPSRPWRMEKSRPPHSGSNRRSKMATV